MKKNLFFGMFAAATMLFATSCSNEELDGVLSGKESVVSFTLEQPGIATRAAYSDGLTATTLTYAVYEAGTKTPLITSVDQVTFTNKTATVNFRLVTGKSYDILFWADAENAPYTFDANAQTITVADNLTSQDENRDAFFFAEKALLVDGAINKPITLTRPFAQLNIGTTDATESSTAAFTPTQSKVTVKNVYKTLNLFDGGVSDETELTYAMADIPGEGETFPVADVKYLSMNYLLVASEKELVDVEFTVTDGTHSIDREYASVPVQRNYRTNIYGKILTDPAAFDITIDAAYEPTDYLYKVWDGVSATEFTPAELEAEVIELNSAADLAGIAQLTIGGNQLAGKTIKLETDIDLAGMPWKPIGPDTSDKKKLFAGTFDGGGHVITGFKLESDQWGAGFIGHTTSTAVVKNVHLVGCDVSNVGGQKTGALVGWNHGKVENCSLTAGDFARVFGNTHQVGGLVGHNDQGGSVKDCKVIGAVKVIGGQYEVGAVVGRNYGTIEGCSVVNEGTEKAEIYATRVSPENWDGETESSFEVGGIAGYSPKKGSTMIKNCVVKGNIELRGMKNVGGIAGIFGGVELTGCTVEGVTICSNFNGGGLIGNADNTTSKIGDCSVANVTLKSWTENFQTTTLKPFIGSYVEIALTGNNTVDGSAVVLE